MDQLNKKLGLIFVNGYQIYQNLDLKILSYILSFPYKFMLYDSPLSYTREIFPHMTLPNIHPQSLDCIIRAENTNRGSLYVSNLEAVQNIEVISKLKVSSILTCAEGYRLDQYPEVQLYKYFPLPENPRKSLNHYFNEATAFIKDSLSKTNCIVHCLTGQNKSIAVIISYLMKYHFMSFDDSLSYVQRKRKLINLDDLYQNSLKEYEQYLHQINIPLRKTKLKTNFISPKTQKTQNAEFQTASKRQVSINSKPNSLKQLNPKMSQTHISEKVDKPSDEKVSVKNSQVNKSIHRQKITDKNKTQRSEYLNSQKNLETHSVQKSMSASHKEAIPFESVLSSAHVDFVGVKRSLKSPATSFLKSQHSSIHFVSEQHKNPIIQTQMEKDFLKVQDPLQKSRISYRKSQISQPKSHIPTQLSERKSLNKSNMRENHEHLKTKRSNFGYQNNSYLSQLNPEHQEVVSKTKINQNTKSRRPSSCSNASQLHKKTHTMRTETQQLQISNLLNPQFEIQPSRKNNFQKINNELNSNIGSITSTFEIQIGDLRLKFQDRLRGLRMPAKSSNFDSPYIKLDQNTTN